LTTIEVTQILKKSKKRLSSSVIKSFIREVLWFFLMDFHIDTCFMNFLWHVFSIVVLMVKFRFMSCLSWNTLCFSLRFFSVSLYHFCFSVSSPFLFMQILSKWSLSCAWDLLNNFLWVFYHEFPFNFCLIYFGRRKYSIWSLTLPKLAIYSTSLFYG
jgi:hypothetical protein